MSSEAAQKAYPERVLPLYPEPPIGTWARDRFGGITYRQENGGWGQPGVMPFGKWEAMYDARGPYVETGPWGKPLGGGAMSTRDELAAFLESEHFDGKGCGTNGTNGCVQCYGPSPMSAHEIADALIAEGWRKKPSEEQIAEALDEATSSFGTGFWATGERDHLASAILALMDRGQ